MGTGYKASYRDVGLQPHQPLQNLGRQCWGFKGAPTGQLGQWGGNFEVEIEEKTKSATAATEAELQVVRDPPQVDINKERSLQTVQAMPVSRTFLASPLVTSRCCS